MKGIYCAIFLVVCLGVSSCGNVFNDQLDVKGPTQETGEGEGLNDDPTFFAIIDGRRNDKVAAILEEDDGSIIIAGNTNSYEDEQSDAWIIKTDAFGNILKQMAFGGYEDNRVISITRMPDGGYLLAGDSVSRNDGDKDFWLVKLSSSLDILWERIYGNDGNDYAKWVFQEEDGDYVIIGHTDRFGAGGMEVGVIWTDAEGNIRGETTHGLSGDETVGGAVFNPVSGRYVIAINTLSFYEGYYAVRVLEVDSAGTAHGEITLHGARSTIANSMIAEEDGEMVIVGMNYVTSLSYYCPWAIKLNSQLQVIWEYQYANIFQSWFNGINRANDGTYLLAGQLYTKTTSYVDMQLTHLRENGLVIKSITAGGESTDSAISMIQSKSGRFIIAGESQSFGCESWGQILATMDADWKMDESGLNFIEWQLSELTSNTKVTAGTLTAMKNKINARRTNEEPIIVTETDAKSRFIR
jgi:hypothetical protein